MRTASLIDARSGYYTDEAYELIPANGLLKGENCYWRDGLQQRGGHQPYATGTFAASDVVRGASKRYYINGGWIHILAIDVNGDSEVRFFSQATTTIFEINIGFSFTTGYEVYFDEIDGRVVAVNGVDKPAVIYLGDLIDRGDCESTISPMIFDETTPVLSNATWVRDNAQAYAGTYSFKYTKTVANGTASSVDFTDVDSDADMHGLIAGKTYKFSVRVYIPSGGIKGTEINIRIYEYTSGLTNQACVNTYDEWQFVELEITLDAGTTGLYIRILTSSAAAINEYFYVDNISISDQLKIENLEKYDERDRDETTWNAGQYTDSGTVYTDDTTDAQDAGANDFQLASTTNNDGFFIACTHTFNKVVLKSAQQAAGSPVIEYKYYADDGTWKSCSMVTTPTWTDAEADRTIEFNYPSDMGRYDGAESILVNRFMLRVRFTTAPSSAFSCDYATVHHTQYITQITGADQPHYVISHNSRLWLAVGYIVYYSPPNRVTGWRGLSESEYFLEGGPEVRSMVSHKGYLVVFKDNAIYAFYGNSLDSFLRRKMADVGIEEILSSVSGGEEVYYLSQDGIRMFNGPKNIKVSKHIKSDIEGFTRTGAVAIYYKGEVWLSFPSESKLLVFDPATMRVDEETGDGAVSFFKFTGYKVDYFINCNGKGDTGKLLAVVNDSTPYIAELETGTNDKDRAGSNVNIDWKFKTNYFALINILQEKKYGIFKCKLKRASADTVYAVTLEADGGTRTKSANIAVTSGSGYYNHVSRIPYELDGYNLAIQIRNNQLQDAGFRGLSLEYEKKEF